MSSKQEPPIQAMGFWVFGSLSVVLAVLTLTVAGYWSWWRVMLPFLAFFKTFGGKGEKIELEEGARKSVTAKVIPVETEAP